MPRFLPVPVDGRALAGHDEAVLMVPSAGYGSEVWGHDETVQRASKKTRHHPPAGEVGRQHY